MRFLNLLFKYFAYLGPFVFFSYLFQRFILKNNLIWIKVSELPHKIAIRNNTSDIPLFANIFILKEYNVALGGEVKLIIDCGANIGLATLYFLTKYPLADIIAIEPESNNYNMLIKNLQHYKNVTCLNKGIWSKTTFLDIVNEGGGNHAFVLQESKQRKKNSIEVLSLRDLMDQYLIKDIDILKIDIEGSEEQVMLNNPADMKRARIIFCEIHENMKPGLTDKILQLFNQDYEIFMHGEYHVFKQKNDLLN